MEQTLLTEITKYLDPSMMVVVIVLMLIGFGLKSTPMVPDWAIIWTLPTIGVVFALFLIGQTVEAVMQGILAAAMAVLLHQLWKQSTTKKAEDNAKKENQEQSS